MAGYIGSQTPVVSNGSQRKYTFTATAAQTVFTGMDIPNPQQIQVFQNGVRLVITTDYTVSSGTTVTLVNAASAGDSLVVILFADYQLLDQDLSGDFSVDSPTFVVDSASNNVGIGTSSLSNGLRTVIQGSQTGGAPATSGTTQTYGLLRLQGTTFTSALDMGTNGGNYAWIQSTDQSNLATNYNLALNPNGGNVGIGTTSLNKSSSSAALTVNTGTAANYSALELSSGDTLNWHINANNGNVYDVTAGSRNRIFYTNGSERLRILSSGGITFNGDTAAANALDDYEEGTWTPTVNYGTVSSLSTWYTKVGNIVSVGGLIYEFSDRSTGDQVIINNLPFTAGSTLTAGSVFFRHCNITGNQLSCYTPSASTNLQFWSSSFAGGYSTLTHSQLNSADARIFFGITYQT